MKDLVMDMTTIYLVRHAEAEGNLCRRMHGCHDSNLTSRGLKQIRCLRDRFADVRLDACYCSDLTRAKNTAQAICDASGLEFRVDPGFREVGVGIWEDVPFGYLNTYHGLKMTQFGKDPVNWTVTGSETFLQYTKRFLESMESAAKRHAGGSIAIVSHSIVMRGVLSVLFPEMVIPRTGNTSVTCLQFHDNGTYTASYFGDSSHLDPALTTNTRQKWWQQRGAQGDDTFWYREGKTDLDDLDAPDSEIVFTVLEAEQPVGLICLSDVDEMTGCLEYLGLVEPYRGFDLSIQLLGQAVFTLRAMGKRRMIVANLQNPAMEALCRKMPFTEGEGSTLVLNLTCRVQPY